MTIPPKPYLSSLLARLPEKVVKCFQGSCRYIMYLCMCISLFRIFRSLSRYLVSTQKVPGHFSCLSKHLLISKQLRNVPTCRTGYWRQIFIFIFVILLIRLVYCYSMLMFFHHQLENLLSPRKLLLWAVAYSRYGQMNETKSSGFFFKVWLGYPNSYMYNLHKVNT